MSNISASSDIFAQWCLNWVKVNVTATENELVGGMFLIADEEIDGVNETVLKLYNNRLANCADNIDSDDTLAVTMRLKELQWGFLTPQD